MPVSYRYHAYSPQRAPSSRKLKTRSKQKLTESELAAHHTEAEGQLHYGHPFAETEERLHERQRRGRQAPKMSRPQQQGELSRGMPIGALPETEEAITEPDRLLEEREVMNLDALIAEATRQVEIFTGAIKDLGSASWRLARFPVDAARAFRNRRNRR